jgi:hypothetical protein
MIDLDISQEDQILSALAKPQSCLIRVLNGLPPLPIRTVKLTEDQIKHYKETRFYFQLIKIGFIAKFTGHSANKVLKAGIEAIIEREIDPNCLSFAVLIFDRWWRLYDLLTYGWEEIEQFSINKSVKMPASNPCDALAFILYHFSIYQFAKCLEAYWRISYQQFYRDCQTWKKIEAKTKTKTPLNEKEAKTLKKLISKTKNNPLKEFTIGCHFEHFCIDILSQSKDKTIFNALKAYSNAVANLERENLKLINPRKNPKGEEFREGRRIS